MIATDTLRTDHRTIGRMLTIVQKAANCLDFGQPMSPQVFLDADDFFASFVDGFHCRQEERALFAALEHAPIAQTRCSLAIFTTEHAEARERARAMATATQRFARGDGRARRALVLGVRAYVNLMRSHIIREDYDLFVSADTTLPEAEQQRLQRQYLEIENALHPIARARYIALVEKWEHMAADWTLPGVEQTAAVPFAGGSAGYNTNMHRAQATHQTLVRG